MMARYTSGGVSRATANTVKGMQRSAESRRCPQCDRKSALKHYSDEMFYGVYCRWEDCGYKRLSER